MQSSSAILARPGLRRRLRQRGSVFLIALLLISMLSLVSSSFSLASGSTLEVTADETSGLQAEFLAESAMDFARRQLVLDPAWAGTGEQPMMVGSTGSFEVDLVGEGPNGGILLRVTGITGQSRSMLQAELALGSGGPSALLKGCGLVTYGGDLDMNNVEVNAGGILVVDEEDGVHDWNPTFEDWMQPPISDPEIDAVNVEVTGTLYTYEDPLNGIDADARVTLTDPVRTPKWNMDSFLVPGPDVIITTSASISNLTTTKTLVVNVPAGTHVSLNKCNLKGGLVIYAEDTHTPRSDPRNTLSWKSTNIGSATPAGVVPNLGIFAPASHVTHSTNQTSGYGLFLIHSADHLNNLTIQSGALLILNYINQLNNVQIDYDEDMWTDEIEALFDFGVSAPSVISIQEYYPEV
jgi:general stress protein 26